MTARQREALRWLRRVGKATPTTLRRHGFSARTMEALVAAGVATRETRSGSWGSFAVYRPVDE